MCFNHGGHVRLELVIGGVGEVGQNKILKGAFHENGFSGFPPPHAQVRWRLPLPRGCEHHHHRLRHPLLSSFPPSNVNNPVRLTFIVVVEQQLTGIVFVQLSGEGIVFRSETATWIP